MNCAKALSEDFGNLFLDPQNSDIVLLCQGEEIRAHKLILSARSPVFRAMLQTEMSESVKGEIRIEDSDKDVLKEMVRYMYSAKVEQDFTNYKELLVLANKYEVEELIKYCGTKVIESLTKENALELGIFAETHNADELMKVCIQFIFDNRPNSLNKNWKDQLKGSPKMMLEMLQKFLDNDTSHIHELSRLGGSIGFGWPTSGYIHGVAFEVDSDILLRGIGIFGTGVDQQTLSVRIRVWDRDVEFTDANCLLDENKTSLSWCSVRHIQLLFTKAVPIKANNKYHVTMQITSGGKTYNGQNYRPIVNSDAKSSGPIKFSFSGSRHDNYNNTSSHTNGQIPVLYFSKK